MISSPHFSSKRLPSVEHTLMKSWLLLMLAIKSEVLMEIFQGLQSPILEQFMSHLGEKSPYELWLLTQ